MGHYFRIGYSYRLLKVGTKRTLQGRIQGDPSVSAPCFVDIKLTEAENKEVCHKPKVVYMYNLMDHPVSTGQAPHPHPNKPLYTSGLDTGSFLKG